jgi:hypothetical protein
MTDLPTYRPFGVSDDEYEQLLVLRPGVPADLREPMVGWLTSRLTINGIGGPYVSHDVADKVRMLTGFDLGVTSDNYMPGENLHRGLRGTNEQDLLKLVDALLYLNLDVADIVKPMTETLRLARSKYTVGPRNGSFGLVDRIADGEQASLDRLGNGAGAAGTLLQRSFSAAFGLQSNAGEAYKMAVKAVETAAHQTIEPNNTGATLGTMLGVMRSAPVKWTLPLDERADHRRGNEELLISMMQSIWDGQEDRHRDGVVELSEARAAFHAAVALVGWFHDGLVQHGTQSP